MMSEIYDESERLRNNANKFLNEVKMNEMTRKEAEAKIYGGRGPAKDLLDQLEALGLIKFKLEPAFQNAFEVIKSVDVSLTINARLTDNSVAKIINMLNNNGYMIVKK